jgi:hypothetical protein
MSEMREGSITVPPGVVNDTPWLRLGDKVKGILTVVPHLPGVAVDT